MDVYKHIRRFLPPHSPVAPGGGDPGSHSQSDPASRLAAPAGRLIKVLVLIPSLEIGGTETDLVRTLPLVNREGFKIVVGVLEGWGPLTTCLREAGIEVIGPFSQAPVRPGLLDHVLGGIGAMGQRTNKPVPGSSIPHLLSLGLKYFQTSRRVAHSLRSGRFDVLHAMSPSAYIVGTLANGVTKRRPLVMSRVSLNFYQHDARMFGVVERLMHRRTDLATGNAQAILRELRAEGIPARKLLLMHNGIDSEAFVGSMIDRGKARARLGLSPSALVFTSVANLFPYKGHADLLEALHLLKGRLPANWTLLVAGRDIDGSLDRLRSLAENRALAQHVRFLGQRRDIPAILSAADIHISASHYEGFPNNVLEAMCASLPVVATAVGGLPEQVVDGSTGLLVPPREPTALAQALFVLAEDPSRREALGKAGRERVAQHFAIRRSVATLEQAYASVVARGAAAPTAPHHST